MSSVRWPLLEVIRNAREGQATKSMVLLKSDCLDIYSGSVTHLGMILTINGVEWGFMNPNIILQSYVQTQEKVKRVSRAQTSLLIHRKFFLL